MFDTNGTNQMDPEGAIENLIGDQFLEWLVRHIDAEVKSWPALQRIASEEVKIEKLRKFLLQRFLTVQAFLGTSAADPGFLGFAIANLSENSDPLAENALGVLEKMRDEEVEGAPAYLGRSSQRELWIKLLKALGVSAEEISKAEAKEWTRNYVSELSDIYSNGEWQMAMGAFLAHEQSIPVEYRALNDAVKKSASVDTGALEVFAGHAAKDLRYAVNASDMLEKILLDPESKRLVWEGVARQLEARRDYYGSAVKYLESAA
jgi:hypothetical protein